MSINDTKGMGCECRVYLGLKYGESVAKWAHGTCKSFMMMMIVIKKMNCVVVECAGNLACNVIYYVWDV